MMAEIIFMLTLLCLCTVAAVSVIMFIVGMCSDSYESHDASRAGFFIAVISGLILWSMHTVAEKYNVYTAVGVDMSEADE